MPDSRPHLSENDARAGTTPKMTRTVLVVSLALIVAVFGILFWAW